MTSQTADAHRAESVVARDKWVTSLSHANASLSRHASDQLPLLPGTPSPDVTSQSSGSDVHVTRSPFAADVNLVISKPPNGPPLMLARRVNELPLAPADLSQMAAAGRGISLSTAVGSRRVAPLLPSQPQPLTTHNRESFPAARPSRASSTSREPHRDARAEHDMTSRHRTLRHSLDDVGVYQRSSYGHLPGAGARRRGVGSDVGAPTYRPTQTNASADFTRPTQAALLKQVEHQPPRTQDDSKQAWR